MCVTRQNLLKGDRSRRVGGRFSSGLIKVVVRDNLLWISEYQSVSRSSKKGPPVLSRSFVNKGVAVPVPLLF